MDPKLFPKHILAELINELKKKGNPNAKLIKPEEITDEVLEMVVVLGESLAEKDVNAQEDLLKPKLN